MPWAVDWRKNFSAYRVQFLTTGLMAVLLSFFLGMSESTRLMFDRMSDRHIYSVYEGNLACPMSGLVPEKYVDRLSQVPGVMAVSPEVRQNTVILPGFVVTVLGVVPEKFRIFKHPDISPEMWDSFVQHPNGVLVGKDLAKSIIRRYGQLENNYTIPFKIAGIIDYPLSLLNTMMIAHKDYLKTFLFKGDNVTVINLLFDPAATPQKMTRAIEDRLRDHKTTLVCRPETAVWERAQTGMAQFGKYVHWYAVVVISILFCFSLAQTIRCFSDNRGSTTEGPPKRKNLDHIRLFAMNAFLGSALGVVLAGLIFITRPAFTGFDIFNPPVLVNLPVGLKVFISILCTTLAGNFCGILIFNRLHKKALSWRRIAALAVLPLLLIVFSMNYLTGYPYKLRKDLMNGAEPGNMTVYQAGTSVRIRQASNIPNTVLDVCRLASNIKTANGEKLFSPVVQLAVNIEQRNIPALGIHPASFFKIVSKIHFIEGRQPENPGEIVIGRNVGLKLSRKFALGDTLNFEKRIWKIVGRFEADSYYDNCVIATHADLVEASGRETLQAVLIKLDDPDNSEALSSSIQQYYGMLLDELPDLPRLAISSDLEQVAQLAASYHALFPLNAGMVLIALSAGLLLLRTLFEVPQLKRDLIRALIAIVLSGLIIEAISFFVGRHLRITLALTTFSLQPPGYAMAGGCIVVIAFALYIFFKKKLYQSERYEKSKLLLSSDHLTH